MKLRVAKASRDLRVGVGLALWAWLATSGGAAVQIRTLGIDSDFPTLAPAGSSVIFSSLDPLNRPTAAGALQWQFNNQPIAGATGPELKLASLAAGQTGNYRLAVTADGTTTYSNTETLNVVAAELSPVDRSFSLTLANNVTSASVRLATADRGAIIELYDSGTQVGTTVRVDHTGRRHSTFIYPESAGRPLAWLADGGLITTNAPYRVNANGAPSPLALPDGFDATQPLSAAAVQPDGRFYIAQADQLARLLPNGMLDTSFALTDSAPGDIRWIKLDAQDRLFVGRWNTATGPTAQRFTNSGTRDTAFHPPSEVRTLFDRYTTITDIVSQAAGGYLAFYDRAVVKLADDGTRDEAWGYVALPLRTVFSATADADGNVFMVMSGRLYRGGGAVAGTTWDLSWYPGVAHNDTSWSSLISLQVAGNQLWLSGAFSDIDGHPTDRVARLKTARAAAFPAVASAIQTTPFRRATPLTLAVSIIQGTGPFTYQWLALDQQPLPAKTTGETLDLGPASTGQLGRYQVRITGLGGTTLSPVVNVDLADYPVYLANISGRAVAGVGENTVIAGYRLGSSGDVLARGVGPSLLPAGVSTVVTQPELDVLDGSGQHLTWIDSWRDDPNLATLGAAVGATPLSPGAADAAGVLSWSGSPATLHLLDRSGATNGVGLVEIYTVKPTSAPVNLSLRAQTGPGDATAIAGFVITDAADFGRPAKVLLRAIGNFGPEYGIQHPLLNPVLSVYSLAGTEIARNDDWQDSANLAELTAALNTTSGLPRDPHDAALLLTLPPGVYTMHATGGTGVVLLDVFLVP